MSKKFACSASVVKNPDKTAEIQVQGEKKFELAELALQKFAVPKEKIFFMAEKSKKKTRAF